MTDICFQITINQRNTNNVTKQRNYCTNLSENVQSKHQKEHRDQVCNCTGEMGMDNLCYLNSTLYFISIL